MQIARPISRRHHHSVWSAPPGDQTRHVRPEQFRPQCMRPGHNPSICGPTSASGGTGLHCHKPQAHWYGQHAMQEDSQMGCRSNLPWPASAEPENFAPHHSILQWCKGGGTPRGCGTVQPHRLTCPLGRRWAVRKRHVHGILCLWANCKGTYPVARHVSLLEN